MARTQKSADTILRNGNAALHSGANSALHLASDYADSANEALHAGLDAAHDRFNDASDYAVKRGRKVVRQARGYAADAIPSTTRFVRNNPVLSIGIAVGVGLFLGLSARR